MSIKRKLTLNEGGGLFTHKASFNYNDLITLGTGNQEIIATIPAGGAVALAAVYECIAFAGTSTLVVDVGTTAADPDEFIDALDVDGMTAAVFNTGDAFDAGTATTATGLLQPVKPVATATSILFEFNDANIASATAGEIAIGLCIVNCAALAY